MATVKLPKQWRYWCKLANLRVEWRSKSAYSHFSLKGQGRRWRVNCYNQLSVSCDEKDFDRWALSWVADAEMPKTEAAFLATIADLKKQSIESYKSEIGS